MTKLKNHRGYYFRFFALIIIFKCEYYDVSSQIIHTYDSLEIMRHIDLATKFENAENYDSSIYYARLASYESLNTNQSVFYCESLLKLGKCYFALQKYDKSDSICKVIKATLVNKSIQDSELWKNFYVYNGLVESFLNGNYDLAIELYKKALNLHDFESLDGRFVLNVYRYLSDEYLQTSDHDSATFYQLKALDIIEDRYPYDKKVMALSYKHLGKIMYYSLKPKTSISYYMKSLNILSNQSSLNLKELISVYHGLSVAYMYSNNNFEALEHLKKCRELLKSYDKDHPSEPFIYSTLGDIYKNNSQYNLSIEYYEKALGEFRKKLPEDHPEVAWVYSAMAEAYNFLDLEKSLLFYDKSIDIVKAQEQVLMNQLFSNYNGKCFVLSNHGKLREAKSILNQMEFIAAQNKNISNHEKLNFLFQARNVSYELGDMSTSERYVDRIFEILKTEHEADDFRYIHAYYHKALNMLKLQEFDSSIFFAKKSIEINIHSLPAELHTGDFHNFLVSNWRIYFESLDIIGSAYYNMYLTTKDGVFLKEAISANQAVQYAFKDFLRTSFERQDQEVSIGFHNRAIRNLLSINYMLWKKTGCDTYKNEIIKLSADDKNSLLRYNLLDSRINPFKTLPTKLQRTYLSIRSDIDYYKSLILSETDSIARGRYIDSLISHREKQEAMTNYIRKEYKHYYDLKYEHESPSICRVQQRLEIQNQAVINYSLTDTLLYIYYIDPAIVEIQTVKIDSAFYSLVVEYPKVLARTNKFRGDKESMNWLDLSYALYSKLIKPIESLIENKDLVIIPDAQLAFIPFETLSQNFFSDMKADFTNSLLLASHNISYIHSIYNLMDSGKMETVNTNSKIIAFAPYFIDTYSSDSTTEGLAELKWNEKEVKSISKYFKCNFLIDEEATEASFRKNVDKYGIIHLATHGFINQSEPLLHKIAFSPSLKDSLNDHYVNLQELFSMDIPAQLVVLSACNTGQGKVVNGEGVVSLARGFFYAGSKSVVMSLWSVNDRSTANIMENFYKNLSKGLRKDKALRLAKLDYLKSVKGIARNPYFWSQFVAKGDMAPINQERFSLITWTIFSVMSLAIFIILYLKRGVLCRLVRFRTTIF